MEKNKSIDGLSSRRSKKPTTKPVPVKPSAKSKKTASTKKPSPAPKPAKKSRTIKVEEFLEPVRAFDFKEGDKTFKISEQPKKKTKTKVKKEKKKPGKIRKTISTIALILIILIIGGLVWLTIWGNDIIAKITGGQGNIFDLLTFTNETYEPLKTDENGRTNILAFGTSGYNMDGDVGNGTHDGAALTDSIMVISLDQETGDAAVLSLPRDLKASPTCTATGKINEIYWCNNMKGDNEQAGAEALMTEVGNILGIDFQYYSHVNWASIVQIVNTLGDIKITLDENIRGYHRYYEAGVEYTVGGDEALAIARTRYGTDNGDFSRGASQQKIIIGIKDRLIEKNLSIPDCLSLASTLGDNLRTNFSVEELKTLAHLTSSFDFSQVRQISLIGPTPLMTTGTVNGISYVLPSSGAGNYGKIRNYVAKMLSSDPRVYEEPTILILNGSETDGIASSEKHALEKEGYLDITIDNAPEGIYPNNYSIYALTEKPGTKAMLETYYNTTLKTAAELPDNIPRDYDFIIIIGNKEAI